MTTPPTMQAVRAEEAGPPDVLQYIKVPRPIPGPGEVLIRVSSASVNFSDVMRRRGSAYPFPTDFPYTPGSEVSGHVEEIGPDTEAPAPGTSVFAVVGRGGEGGYAQFAIAGAPQVMPVPEDLDLDVAAGLLVAGTTAMLLVHEAAKLKPDETIFVPAAAGGVGSMVVQIANKQGARVIAGASTEAKRARARGLGAAAVIDYSRSDWDEQLRAEAPEGVDVALEMIGGETLDSLLRCIAPFGRVLVYGAASDTPRTLRQETLEHWLSTPALNVSISAFNLGLFFSLAPQRAGSAVGRLIEAIAAGDVKPTIDRVMPLSNAAQAHALLEERQTSGKIVLAPWS